MDVNIDGRKITVEELGNNNNVPVLMIPAMGRPASDFKLLAQELSGAGYWSLMFNPRGVNGSTGLELSLKIDDIAQDVYLYLKKIGVSKAHFIGHAFGTRVARMMAERYPQIALSSTSITLGGLLPPELPYPLLALDMIKNKQGGSKAFNQIILEAYFAKGNNGSIWLDGWYGDVIPAYTLALTRTPQEELMCGGTAPMLIVQGESDVFAPVRAGEIIKNKLREQVRVVNIPNSGHEIIHEQPKLLAKTIMQFLRDVDSKSFLKLSENTNNCQNSNKQKYSLGWSNAVTKFQGKRSINKYSDFLIPYIKKDASILDCGCGMGGMTVELAEIASQGKIFGIDINQKQLQFASQIKERKKLSNLEFMEANIYDLPFSDGEFDVVWMNTLLMHLKEPVDALKEIYRVLKPGGVIGVSDADWDGDIIVPEFFAITESLKRNERSFENNGSHMRQGKYNAFFLNKAGFVNVSATAMVECWASNKEKQDLADFSIAMEYELSCNDTTDISLDMKIEAWKKWATYPGSFFARTHCRALGWKENNVE